MIDIPNNSIVYLIIIFFIALGHSPLKAEVNINDSKSDIEIQISTLLKSTLETKVNLKPIKPDDIQLEIIFAPDPNKNIPAIAAFIDTYILTRNKHKKPQSQVISYISVADISIKGKKEIDLLRCVNSWNSRIVPVKIYLKGDKIIASYNLLIEKNSPASDKQVIRSFVNVMQAWPSIILDLKKNNLLDN